MHGYQAIGISPPFTSIPPSISFWLNAVFLEPYYNPACMVAGTLCDIIILAGRIALRASSGTSRRELWAMFSRWRSSCLHCVEGRLCAKYHATMAGPTHSHHALQTWKLGQRSICINVQITKSQCSFTPEGRTIIIIVSRVSPSLCPRHASQYAPTFVNNPYIHSHGHPPSFQASPHCHSLPASPPWRQP